MFQVKDESIGTIKFVGRSRGKVIDNVDPLKKGRVIVNHPLLGETEWIEYLTSPGMFSVPEIGDIVYVECDAGFATHPLAWGNLTKGKTSAEDVPDVFQRNNPTNRGMYTPDGHLFEMDDGTTLAGTKKGIRLTTANGSKIHIIDDPADIQINLELPTGDQFKMTPTDGIVINANSNIKISSLAGNIEADGSLGKLKLGAGKVGLGGPAAELLDLFDQLLQQLDTLLTSMATETHLGNLGYSTSPPLNAAAYAAVQVQIALIKTLLATIKGGV
jgi:hypothetical protein